MKKKGVSKKMPLPVELTQFIPGNTLIEKIINLNVMFLTKPARAVKGGSWG